MIDEVGRVAAMLGPTLLRDCEVEEGPGSTLFVGGIDGEQVLPAWRAARNLVPQTGRWPVAVLPSELVHEPEPGVVDALDRAAYEVDPWPQFAHSQQEDLVDGAELDRYLAAWFAPEHLTAAHKELQLPTTWRLLERWIYDRVTGHAGLAAQVEPSVEYLVGTRRWHTWHEPVDLLLLPTSSPWLAPAWLAYFGTPNHHGEEALAAVLYQWHLRHGAELVAWWGTMLQLLVSGPPTPGAQAWQVAEQLKAVGGSLQMPHWQLAMAVARSDAWFLHDRP